MKKTTTISILTLTLAVTVAFSSCGQSSTKVPDSNSTTEATTVAGSTKKLSTSQLYDYFAQHGSSLNALIEKGSFTKSNIDDGTIIHFALLELIQKNKKQLEAGKIDEATYQTMTQEFFKDEINQIATNYFGKTPNSYDTAFSSFANESGGVIPKGLSSSAEIRFLPIETTNENSVYKTTFNVYSFPANYAFQESEVKIGDSKHFEQLIGTVQASYTLTVNKTDNSSYITFDKFAFTEGKG